MSKELVISEVLMKMEETLAASDLLRLKECMREVLYRFAVVEEETAIACLNEDDNDLFIKRFAIDMKVEGKSLKTIEQYVGATRKMLDYLGKNFREVTKDDITYYLAMLSAKGLSNTTLDNTRKFVKAFFSWAVFNDYLVKNPFLKVKCIKRNPVRKEVVTEQEIEVMRDACLSKKELAVIDFLYSTGVRVSECTAVMLDNVNLLNGTCEIYADKTDEWRTVYLDAKAVKHIADYREELAEKGRYSPYLFATSQQGKGMSNNSVEEILHRVIRRTNITKNVTVHTFRKTFASRMTRKGMRPESISTLLGHKDYATTSKYYIRVNCSDLRNEYERCVN
ncbi:MAG: hypothetical protein E7287_05150 [Lachnospiraceae bacterium]|nr:hypothetical protein [Lachnospiraceae bacterium]